MLACNVSLLRRRAAIAADVAEIAAALDSPGTGNVVFATLVDDPASVNETVDAYLGEIMIEAASATDTLSASIPAVLAADVVEAATAADTPDGAVGAFATFDGVALTTTLSNGNLTATHNTTSATGGARSASLKSTGKYYFEITYGASHGASDGFGMLMSTGTYTDQMNGQNCFTVFTNFGPGHVYSDSGFVLSNLGSFTTGDVVCFAIDLGNAKAWVRKNNGSWNNSGTANPATNTGGLGLRTATVPSYAPSIAFGNAGNVAGDNATGNFGQTAYAYTPPAGFGNWPA